MVNGKLEHIQPLKYKSKMFKIKKDIVFAIIVILWLTSNISTCLFISADLIAVSNLVWILIMCALILLKNYTSLGNWLEQKI